MKLLARLTDVLGGPQRRRVIILLGGVLALSFADTATVGAAATQLERDLGVLHTQLGLLPAASALIGALATLPAGVLVDRVPRVRLLAISVVLWSLARVYGFILSGELFGAGLGFAAGGTLAGGLSWRAAFAWLAVPGLALAWALVRELPEPARGGADRLPASGAPDGGEQREDALHAQLHARHVEPDPSRVLREDPDGMSLARVVRWVLLIPTNRLLIVSSALGYFFFSGVQTFAVVFLRHRFGLGQAPSSLLLVVVGAGAVVGVLAGGRLADAWSAHGRLDARITVAGGAYLVAAGLLVPALLFGALALALPLLILAVAALGAANPALDAARLDVVPGRLWGRAEGVRTLLRQLATAAAPIAFGLTADAFGTGGTGALTGASETRGDVHDTFLVMLVALVASGLILLWGRGGFARDVATAEAAEYARWRSSR